MRAMAASLRQAVAADRSAAQVVSPAPRDKIDKFENPTSGAGDGTLVLGRALEVRSSAQNILCREKPQAVQSAAVGPALVDCHPF